MARRSSCYCLPATAQGPLPVWQDHHPAIACLLLPRGPCLRGKTIILVTNALQYLPHADHIVWMEEGRIKAQVNTLLLLLHCTPTSATMLLLLHCLSNSATMLLLQSAPITLVYVPCPLPLCALPSPSPYYTRPFTMP